MGGCQGASMGHSSRARAVSDDHNSDVWTQLPSEILENEVIVKLPFASLVKFRRVCKRWCSEVIPRAAAAAARHGQEAGSCRKTLFYTQQYEGHRNNEDVKVELDSLVWHRVNDKRSGHARDWFHPSTSQFGGGENEIVLMFCEGGLLFFAICAYTEKPCGMVREIVVCNPLTGKSKALSLPTKLHWFGRMNQAGKYGFIFGGAVVDSRTGSYELVVAAKDTKGRMPTFLYNSSSCEWVEGPDAPSKQSSVESWLHEYRRSTCCNGNLYWNLFDSVVKFDFRNKMWSTRSIAHDLVRSYQIAAHSDDLRTWEVVIHPLLSSNRVVYLAGPCFRAEDHPPLDALLKLMPLDMTETMAKFKVNESFAYIQDNIFYHIFDVTEKQDLVRILVHDTKENSYSELPVTKLSEFGAQHRFSLSNFWSFSSSLTSVP